MSRLAGWPQVRPSASRRMCPGPKRADRAGCLLAGPRYAAAPCSHRVALGRAASDGAAVVGVYPGGLPGSTPSTPSRGAAQLASGATASAFEASRLTSAWASLSAAAPRSLAGGAGTASDTATPASAGTASLASLDPGESDDEFPLFSAEPPLGGAPPVGLPIVQVRRRWRRGGPAEAGRPRPEQAATALLWRPEHTGACNLRTRTAGDPGLGYCRPSLPRAPDAYLTSRIGPSARRFSSLIDSARSRRVRAAS